ncbi:MAG: dihydrofolate reductase family protein [Nitrospiraceae bacterium]
MTVVRVESLTVSLDGYVAGPNQSLESPMGDGTSELHKWAFSTRTFQEKVLGTNAGATGVDDDIAARGFTNIGAWILGRNMFGPIRGPWPNEDWKGWWGENPPYHVPAFVLTHHPRKTLEMEGGTTFQFVTGGVREALALARDAAGAQDVRIGGGANTIRQFLIEGLIDKMHIAISPVLLGTGEPFFQGINLRELGYECKKQIPTELATHVFIGRGGE